MIPSWARKGAKVVCVLEAKNPAALRHNHPKKDGIYTIRKVVTDSTTGDTALLLEEVVNVTWDIPSQLEPGFRINGFRPLVSDDNEIETVLYHKRKDKLHQRVSTKSRERA